MTVTVSFCFCAIRQEVFTTSFAQLVSHEAWQRWPTNDVFCESWSRWTAMVPHGCVWFFGRNDREPLEFCEFPSFPGNLSERPRRLARQRVDRCVQAEEDDVGYSIPEARKITGWFFLKMAAPGMTVLVFQLVSGVNLTRAVVALGSFQILNVCGLGFQNLRCWTEFVDAQVCSILEKKNKAIWWCFCGPHEEW